MRTRSYNLGPASPTLAHHQRSFFESTLPRGLSVDAFARFDRTRWPEHEVEWALLAWEDRTLDEVRSHASFCEFLTLLVEFDASWDVLAGATRLVRDEAVHVEICRRLVGALGGSDVLPGTPTWTFSEPGRPLFEQVLWTIAGSLCFGETLSARILAAGYKVARAPIAKQVLKQLTRDEAFHGQFGWELFALYWPRASKTLKRRIESLLREAKAQVVPNVLGEASLPGLRRNPFGEVQQTERHEIITRCLEVDIGRRFEAAGVKWR